jgi:hypothetical protein
MVQIGFLNTNFSEFYEFIYAINQNIKFISNKKNVVQREIRVIRKIR